jgi:transcriptional regulator with XRE-family HTH domain
MQKDQDRFKAKFAMRLRSYRTICGFEFAREFAQEIGEQENTYTRWERGEVMPNLKQLVRIAWTLGITPNDLLWPKLRHGQTLNWEIMREHGIDTVD